LLLYRKRFVCIAFLRAGPRFVFVFVWSCSLFMPNSGQMLFMILLLPDRCHALLLTCVLNFLAHAWLKLPFAVFSTFPMCCRSF
jgi:hypothetical protein